MALATQQKTLKLLKITEESKTKAIGDDEATTLDDLDRLSGGDINAIIVWRKDGNIEFFVPDGKKKVKPLPGNSTLSSPKLTRPKRSMLDHDLPTADIVLIAGLPKIASLNGTLFELEDISTMV